jgi:hypothetical protein
MNAKLAFGWDVIKAIPRNPELIPMFAKLAINRVIISLWCLLVGVPVGDMRREAELRKQAGMIPVDPAAIPKITAWLIIRDLVAAAVWRRG